MLKTFACAIAVVAALSSSSAAASTIVTFSAPAVASGPFDVVLNATHVFDGRDEDFDGIILFGFRLAIGNPLGASLVSATAGLGFDNPTITPTGAAGVFDVIGAASGFGLFPPIVEPLQLVTLRFLPLAVGPIVLTFTTDPASGVQGLQFFEPPFQDPIAGVVRVAAVPEPATLLLLGSGVVVNSLRRRRRSESGR